MYTRDDRERILSETENGNVPASQGLVETHDDAGRHVGMPVVYATGPSLKSYMALGLFGVITFLTAGYFVTYHQSYGIQRKLAQVQYHRRASIVGRARQFIGDLFVGISLEPGIGFGIESDGKTAEDADNQCPGQERYKGLYQEIPGMWSTNLGDFGIEELTKGYQRSFMVEPNHTILKTGVLFNVEAVPDARPEDLKKTRLSHKEIMGAVETEAERFYDIQTAYKKTSRSGTKMTNKTLMMNNTQQLVEVASRMMTKHDDNEGGGTIFASGHGFLAACMTAFAYHLPLALSPDDIWIVIANGFARHVNQHAEELRSNFVNHTGQAEIKIREDSMKKGSSPPEQWEELVFPKFSKAIAEAVGNASSQVHDILAGQNFTTSTPASLAASEIILMASMKSYFKFKLDTMCGIPNVRLDGTREDWDLLRNRTRELSQWMMQNHTHGDLWIEDIVLPILEEFVDSYDRDIDYCFWQNMIKFRTTGMGSGAYDFLSGWLPTLFPYLHDRWGGLEIPNPYLRPWRESASSLHLGPKPNEIPTQISSVPVEWNYFGETYDLHFHSGFRGVHQEGDGTVRPIIGWYITEDPMA